MRLFIAILAAVATLALTSSAQAAPNVQISEIDCFPGHAQDFIWIRNSGDAPQSLSGWQARSDPETTQRFDLGFIGSIPPGGEIILNAGLHSVNLPAENLYQWSISEVLRDDDQYDYARVLDATGNQITGMTCAGGPVDITQPTPVATPKPAETPAPAPGTPAPTARPLAEEIGPLPPGIAAGAQRNPMADAQQGAPGAPASDNSLPGVGGRPGEEQDHTEFILATGLVAILAGSALIATTRRPIPDSEARRK